MVLEKTLASPLECKEIQPVHPIGDQSWVFIGRTDVEAETPILWPPYVKSWLIGKDPDARKDEMAGWHHWLNGHGFGWTLGVGDGQGGLACCGSWGHKESDTTERLNWTELKTWMEISSVVPGQYLTLWLQEMHRNKISSFLPGSLMVILPLQGEMSKMRASNLRVAEWKAVWNTGLLLYWRVTTLTLELPGLQDFCYGEE